MLFRVYRIARAVHNAYALGVFWGYVGLFVLTFALIFVFPPAALVLIFAALTGLLFVVIGAKLLAVTVFALARGLLGRGVCPSCAMHQLPDPEATEWTCQQCGSCYLRSGREQLVT